MSFPGSISRRHLPVVASVLALHAAALWATLTTTESPPAEPLPVADTVTAVWLTPESPPATPMARPQIPAAPHPVSARAPTPVPTQPVPTPMATAPAPAVPTSPLTTAAVAGSAPSASPAATGSGGVNSSAPSASAAAGAATAPVVELPSSTADYLHNPKPPYPPLSKRLGEQGVVELRVYINTDGSAGDAEVRRTSGYDRLDKAALQAALRWRYKPGKRNGVPEAMWANVPIHFVLE